MSDNNSFVLQEIQKADFEQRPVPEIDDEEVLVTVKKTGICGSDVHYLVHGRIGDFIVNKPMVLGHESSGIIVKVGPKVKHLKIGDRVCMEPGATCRSCADCKSGRYELCPDIVFAATPPHDGTLGRYYKLPAHVTYKLPENLSMEDGAMMEPLSVAVHAVSTLAQLKTNQTVAVFGCGPVGLLCMAVAKALGASRIVAVDINPDRLAFAKKYAATDGFLSPPLEKSDTSTIEHSKRASDVANDGFLPPPLEKSDTSTIEYSKRASDVMKEQLGIDERGSRSIDVVLDASGAEPSIQMGLFIVKIGGIFVQVGMGKPEVVVPITMLLVKELVVKGSFRYGPGDYPLAIALAAQGRVDLKPLVTHRFKFDDALQAFNTTRAGKGEDGQGVIKAIISGPGVDPQEL